MAILNSAAVIRFALIVLAGSIARAQTADEYQVKAAYMYNFAKFVSTGRSRRSTVLLSPLCSAYWGGLRSARR